MSAIDSQNETGLDWIRIHLDRFDQFELGRSTHSSLAEYLRALVAVQALPAEAASQLTSLYYRSRFGEVENDSSQISNAIEQLEAAQRRLGELDKQELTQIADRWKLLMDTETESTVVQDAVDLDAEQAPSEKTVSLAPQRDDSQSFAELYEPEPEELTLVQPPRRLFGRRPRFFVFVGLGFFVWTFVVLLIGYVTHDDLEKLYWEVCVRYGQQMSSDESSDAIRRLRSQIRTGSRSSQTISRLKKLAALHEGRGEYAEAICAHQQAVNRAPKDAILWNNFAWMLLTVENSWYRDPDYALILARRAFSIDQRPLITDTLAEAHFQNGNFARAVRLEEIAIANETQQGRKSFYKTQLAKFKAAGGKSRGRNKAY